MNLETKDSAYGDTACGVNTSVNSFVIHNREVSRPIL